MAEELVVTLNRGDSSGFGFSLLGTAGLPHVIYDIVENSPAAKSGKVSTRFDRIFYTFALPIAWYHSKREKFEDGRRWSCGKSNPSFAYTCYNTRIHYALVRESCEREGPQNNARCISTRVIIASTLCRPVCFLTSDYFLFSHFANCAASASCIYTRLNVDCTGMLIGWVGSV